jgi:hypothetical protein
MKTQRKAFIDQIMLGFFLIAFTTIFIGTVSDEIQMRSKYTNLKKVLQTAVLSSAKYYSNEQPIPQQAEEIALNIIAQTALGAEVKDDIDFEWDLDSETKSVIATLPQYREDLFWFRLLHFDTIDFTNISAKANIIDKPLENVDNFLPIAVNGCTQEFQKDTTYDFVLNTAEQYDVNNNFSFFSLFTPPNIGTDFSQLTTSLANMTQEKTSSFNLENGELQLATMLSTNLSANIAPLAQAFNISNFSQKDVSIVVLGCDSSSDNLVIKKLLPVHLEAVHCGKGCSSDFFPIAMMCKLMEMFQNMTEDIFKKIEWSTDSSKCSNEFFKLRFKVRTNETVQLEY